MYHISIIHASVKGHLGCLHFLTIVNGAAMNMDEQVSVKYDVKSVGHTPGSGMTGLPV